MALPLRKNISIALWITGLTLTGLLVLGLRQAQLTRSHGELTAQAEKTVFQFTIIREHMQEVLLAGQYDKLGGVAAELEEVNGSLTQLLGGKEVAEEYRLALLNGLDLAGTILLLRKLAEGPVPLESVRQLNGEMRTLGERLQRFDRLLVSSAKTRLLRYQNVVIGLLAVLLSLLVGMLLWLKRRMVTPLAQLGAGAARAWADEGSGLMELPGSCPEIEELGRVMTQLLHHRQILAGEVVECDQLIATLRQATRAMVGASERGQLFREVCRALLHNPAYCLVWIGEPDGEGGGIQPAAADGSTTMSRKECESCLAVLLTEAEERGEEHNPALQALRSRQPVVRRDILAAIPRGLLKGTVLAEGEATCVALPVQWQGCMHGVITIYSLAGDGFGARELALLESLADALALAASGLGVQQQLNKSAELLHEFYQVFDLAVIGIGGDGRVVSANAVAARLAGYGAGEMTGRHWQELLRPVAGLPAQSKGTTLLEAMSNSRQGATMLLASKEGERPLWGQVIGVGSAGDAAPSFWCLAVIPGRQPWQAAGDEARRSARLALLGEIAIGVAHEISDLSNGMINYAQVLADEAVEGAPAAQLLGNIITAGEHIAAMVGKLHFYGEEAEPEEYLSVLEVLRDAMVLGQYHLRKAGIKVSIELPEELPALPVNARQLQQVLLEIFSHARRALNLRYPGRHENKRFQIEAEVVSGSDGEVVRLSFTDYGAGLAAHQLDHATTSGSGAGDEEGLARGRRLVERHGGRMSITGVSGEYTTVSLDFPTN